MASSVGLCQRRRPQPQLTSPPREGEPAVTCMNVGDQRAQTHYNIITVWEYGYRCKRLNLTHRVILFGLFWGSNNGSGQLSSFHWPIGSSRGHDGRFSRDPFQVFSARGRCEQFWHRRECPFFDVSKVSFCWIRLVRVLHLNVSKVLLCWIRLIRVLHLDVSQDLFCRIRLIRVLHLDVSQDLFCRIRLIRVLHLDVSKVLLLLPWTRRIVEIPAHARTAPNGLLQKRLEGDLCWNGHRVPSTTRKAFPLMTTASPAFRTALRNRFGQAVVKRDMGCHLTTTKSTATSAAATSVANWPGPLSLTVASQCFAHNGFCLIPTQHWTSSFKLVGN